MRKTPDSHEHQENAKSKLQGFKDQLFKIFNFPFLDKKEWLDIPKLGNEMIPFPDRENFIVEKQENKDSCGTCAGKMVMNAILKDIGSKKTINEKDILRQTDLPRVSLFKEYIGITPGELQTALQEILSEYRLPYTAIEKHALSYPEIKDFLKKGAYIIFSYMGNSIDNPYRIKDGKKDISLKNIHHPHYIILLQIDEKKKMVTIANPFGYQEELPINEFWERISLDHKYLHSNPFYLPLVESGLYMPRTCVIITPNA